MPLQLKRRHGSPYWYIRGTVRGVTVDESTGLSDKKQAEAVRSKREWEVLQDDLTGRRATATFLAIAVSYMEGGGEARYVMPLVDHFGTTLANEIGQVEAEAAGRALYPGCSPSTINRCVFTPLSAVTQHGAVRGMCELKTFERPPQPKGRVRWLTIEEADRLCDACADHLRPLVIFLLYTGARLGEALTLDWRDVSLARAHVVFLDTKNGENRGVPLHPRPLIEMANLQHREGRVFRTPAGLPYRNNDAGGSQIKTAFRGGCKRAGIKDFHPHDCRHTWATWHYAANRDLLKLAELGGWKTVSMVTRYAHINASHLADSIMALPGGQMGTVNSSILNIKA